MLQTDVTLVRRRFGNGETVLCSRRGPDFLRVFRVVWWIDGWGGPAIVRRQRYDLTSEAACASHASRGLIDCSFLFDRQDVTPQTRVVPSLWRRRSVAITRIGDTSHVSFLF